jgi:hypothetical protein
MAQVFKDDSESGHALVGQILSQEQLDFSPNLLGELG